MYCVPTGEQIIGWILRGKKVIQVVDWILKTCIDWVISGVGQNFRDIQVISSILGKCIDYKMNFADSRNN